MYLITKTSVPNFYEGVKSFFFTPSIFLMKSLRLLLSRIRNKIELSKINGGDTVMKRKIGFIVGSLRKDSYSKKTAEAFEKLFSETIEIGYLTIGDLPFYNEDLETKNNVPQAWTFFRAEAAKYDAFVFFTPEYNRSVPAVLKNAIDVGSRPYGASIWDGKPALVVSVSIGAIAGFGANHHLRQALTFLNMPTLQQPEAYVGNVAKLLEATSEFPEGTLAFFQTITDTYLDFVDKFIK